MRKEDSGRRFSRELKLAAVQRMAIGANVSKLSRELGVSRKGLYQWQKQFRVGGPSALRGAGRPRCAEAVGLQAILQCLRRRIRLTNCRTRWLGSPNWSA